MICSITYPIPISSLLSAYLEQLHDLPLVRDGSLRVLDFNKLTGIVTFPSFHAAAAVLYLWAFWPVRWIGPIALVTNIAMLLATPICGGHYFVDVFAGIAIATASIMAARWIADWLTASGESKRHLCARVRGPRRIAACHIHVTPAKNRGRVKSHARLRL